MITNLSSDIEAFRSANSLVLKIKNSSDQITVANYFQSAAWQVEEITFTDEPWVTWRSDNLSWFG